MRLLLLTTLLTFGGLQQPPAPPPAQPFRSGTQIVEVDVRVLGKDGRFVTDLVPADFEIAEEGVRRKSGPVILIKGTRLQHPQRLQHL